MRLITVSLLVLCGLVSTVSSSGGAHGPIQTFCHRKPGYAGHGTGYGNSGHGDDSHGGHHDDGHGDGGHGEGHDSGHGKASDLHPRVSTVFALGLMSFLHSR